MPQLVKNRRSGWAVLAVGALVASLFAVGASPAATAEIKSGDANEAEPSFEADYSACVGDAMDDQMFSDVSEAHAFGDAINCLAHYEITIGYGDGTFRPNVDVSRAQMVLFMERAAALVGAEGADVVGDFATTGSDPVDRADMALLISRLVIGGTPKSTATLNDSGKIVLYSTSAFDYFDDARSSEPRHLDDAISALYELGVTTGTGDGTTFTPDALVTRGAMAAFITRALAHTNARPAGVTAQVTSNGSIRVSVRTDDHKPEPNTVVDVFYVKAARAEEAFNNSGSCTRLAVTLAGNTRCKIDSSDTATDLSGNVVATVKPDASKGAVVWAWTGDEDDAVDSGTELFRLDIPPTPTKVAATSALVTTSLPQGAKKARFGSVVTVTVQLQGVTTVTKETVNTGPPKGGASYTVIVKNADGSATVNELKMGSDGSASFDVTEADPDPKKEDASRDVDWELTALTSAAGNKPPEWPTNVHATPDKGYTADPTAVTSVTFDDDASVIRKISVEAADYISVPTTSTRNYVTVSVTDQYGSGIPDIPVTLRATNDKGVSKGVSDDNANFHDLTRVTVESGMVQMYYTYSGKNAATQYFEAVHDTTASDPVDSGKVTVYWAVEGGASGKNGTVIAADLEKGEILVDSNGPRLLVIDSNDRFSSKIETVTTYGKEAFEASVALDADLTTDPTDSTEIYITWDAYNPNDSADVTDWQLSDTI